MVKLKSVTNTITRHLEKFGEPSQEDYALIQELLPSDIPKSDIYVYSIKLCDNLVDREGEFFSLEALAQLADCFIGRTGVLDHEWKTENQHSRIYKTKLVTDNDKQNESLEPYTYIVGYAYMLNTEKNKNLIDSVGAGILKEVSIGFREDSATEVTLASGEVVKRIDTVKEALEFSFVAVPAQREAGVVKSYNQEEEVTVMKFSDALLKLKSVQGVDPTAIAVLEQAQEAVTQSETLQATIKSLEETVTEKETEVENLKGVINSKTLEDARNLVLGDLKPVNEAALAVAQGVIDGAVTLNDEGEAEGVEAAQELLKGDYAFLFVAPEAETTKESEETHQEKTEEDTLKGLNASKGVSKKGIAFSTVSNLNTGMASNASTKSVKGIRF